MKNATFKIAAAAVAVASAFTSQAYAAGFMLTEQSAGGLGRAYAGVGVDGSDISGVFYNPATMTLHKGSHFQAGFVSIGLDLPFQDTNGNTIENGRYKEQPIPHGFMAKQMSENLWLGLGMTVPFGMGTEFNDDWEGNRRGVEATILTFDVNPNIAWKINDKFSIGAGASVQYAKAQMVTYMPLKAGPIDLSAMKALDLRAKIRADNLAYGWNIGMMWTPVENVRLGLSYRSEIEHNADGDLTVTVPQAITGVLPMLPPSMAGVGTLAGMLAGKDVMFDGGATLSAPAWAMLNAAWDINDKYSVYGTFRWTDWSSFDELQIEAAQLEGLIGKLPSIHNQWKDTYLFTFGGDYRYNDQWTFRAGIGYETSPVDKPETRMAVIPDADRWWFSVGTNYKYNDNFEFDLSFAHLRGVHERSVYESDAPNAKELGRFDKLDAYLLGAQMQYHF